MGTIYKLGLAGSFCVGIGLCVGLGSTVSSDVVAYTLSQPFSSQAVSLPGAYSALQLKHQDRSLSLIHI